MLQFESNPTFVSCCLCSKELPRGLSGEGSHTRSASGRNYNRQESLLPLSESQIALEDVSQFQPVGREGKSVRGSVNIFPRKSNRTKLA